MNRSVSPQLLMSAATTSASAIASARELLPDAARCAGNQNDLAANR
jgi:hypothetical protein